MNDELDIEKSVAEVTGDFEAEVFLSTDGKHTVHFKAQTSNGRVQGYVWARETYKNLVEAFGTKAQMWEKTMSKETSKTPVTASPVAPQCGIHGTPMVWKTGNSKTTGKPYAFWSCPTRNADNSYCSYKPEKKEQLPF